MPLQLEWFPWSDQCPKLPLRRPLQRRDPEQSSSSTRRLNSGDELLLTSRALFHLSGCSSRSAPLAPTHPRCGISRPGLTRKHGRAAQVAVAVDVAGAGTLDALHRVRRHRPPGDRRTGGLRPCRRAFLRLQKLCCLASQKLCCLCCLASTLARLLKLAFVTRMSLFRMRGARMSNCTRGKAHD